jgi:thiol-disulfide isomerase/thioredoxin
MGAARAASFVLLAVFVSAAGAVVPPPAAQDKWEILDQGNDPASKTLTAARVDLRNERYDEAIKGFKKAAEQRNGQCVQCYTLMAEAYSFTGKFKDAAAAVKQAIALKEGEAELYNQLGVYLYKENDKKTLQDSADAFQRAIDLSKGKAVIAYFNLGHALIKQGKEKEGIDALKSYIEADPGSSNAAEARAVIASPRLANENLAPGFNVRSVSGDDVSLEKLKGKIVLLDFWATWCGPCREEMPAVKEIWKKYRGDQFVILGISLDRDRGALNRYLSQEGITWPQVYDRAGDQSSLSRMYGVRGIPHTVLIDQDGIVRAVGLRGGSLSSKVGELIKKLSKQAARTQAGL